MISLPWKYLQENLVLSSLTPLEVSEKLNYYGLETQLVNHENNVYLEFVPFPNRVDLTTAWGLLQEIGAILNCQVSKPTKSLPLQEQQKKPIQVVIDTPDCSEFRLGFIQNAKVKESPQWLKEWLKRNGFRAINNIVDSANLAMLESGQPLHVFAADSLREKKITVRRAFSGEVMKTSQERLLELNTQDLVISSEKQIISLAGIIGNPENLITPVTKNILIECASFNSETIKKTTQRLNIATAASQRFSRKVNSIFPSQQVLSRAISLIVKSYEGDLSSTQIFTFREPTKPKLPTITISRQFITYKTGQELPIEFIEKTWKRLGFSYQKKKDCYQIVVPRYRLDISAPEDLLEELLRIYDYNQIISSLPA